MQFFGIIPVVAVNFPTGENLCWIRLLPIRLADLGECDSDIHWKPSLQETKERSPAGAEAAAFSSHICSAGKIGAEQTESKCKGLDYTYCSYLRRLYRGCTKAAWTMLYLSFSTRATRLVILPQVMPSRNRTHTPNANKPIK